MADWSLVFTSKAVDDVDGLDEDVKIMSKIKWFGEKFDQLDPLPLHAKWRGFFKFRIGD